MPSRRPNILLLYTDQQRKDSVSAYGGVGARTPNLDRLASEGARLESLFVQAPVCMPSRMSMLSGRYCSSLGIGDNGPVFPRDAQAVQHLLGRAGYRTIQVGKLHFQPHAARDHRDPPERYGFDTIILSDEPGCYDDDYISWVAARDPGAVAGCRCALPGAARRFGHASYSEQGRRPHQPYAFGSAAELTHSSFVARECSRLLEETASSTRPFFMIAGFYAPHAPVNPPREWLDRFDPATMPVPIVGPEEAVSPELEGIGADAWRRNRAAYNALVGHVDDAMGRILETLERTGMAEDTLVIMTSDHGEFMGDHGRVGKGMPGHDCITNVPCVLRLPGRIAAGTVSTDIVEAVDLVPTMLDAAGLPWPSWAAGRSLLPHLGGEVRAHGRDSALCESFDHRGNRSASLRTPTHRYFTNGVGTEILFDLASDPDETRNVVDDPAQAEALCSHRRLLLDRLIHAQAPGPVPTAPY